MKLYGDLIEMLTFYANMLSVAVSQFGGDILRVLDKWPDKTKAPSNAAFPRLFVCLFQNNLNHVFI